METPWGQKASSGIIFLSAFFLQAAPLRSFTEKPAPKQGPLSEQKAIYLEY